MTMQTIINPDRLALTTCDGTYFLRPNEILRLEAKSNYTRIHFTNKTNLLSAKVLKEFALMLEPYGFLRTHRTHLVNRHHISYIDTNNQVIMNDNSVAEISKRKKRSVMDALLGTTINGMMRA